MVLLAASYQVKMQTSQAAIGRLVRFVLHSPSPAVKMFVIGMHGHSDYIVVPLVANQYRQADFLPRINLEFSLLAACAFGLEAIVKRELISLGFADARVIQPGKVGFSGDAGSVCRANLWLRTADRILVVVDRFAAADFDQLFETTKAIDWSKWIPRDGQFPVNGRTRNSTLTSVPAIQRSTKRAIVESLKRSYAAELEETGAKFQVEVALLDDQATLTLDTTGPSLHKRGYRRLVAEAPIKETLAAALVMLSFWKAGRPLVDPFCGSGTIPIEAALIGRNIAPGIHRKFISENWPVISKLHWDEAREQAKQQVTSAFDEKIIGTDIDAKALQLARHHAQAAGVAELIHWQEKPFEQLRSKRQHGCTIMNPPYGQRLQEIRQLKSLYKSIPAVLQRLPSWSHFILTSYPRFEAVIQKTADRRRKLYNGRIECTYYQFHGPKPGEELQAVEESMPSDSASVAQPVFGGINQQMQRQADLFATRLEKRARHLRRWPTRGVSCYRLYEKDIPEIPLVVDRYESCLHITELQRPSDRDLGQQAAWLELMARTAAKVMDTDRKNVFVKQRRRQSEQTQHDKVADTGHRITVAEGGLKFFVNLADYVDTGLFLDHRETREMVRKAAQGKRFLNLFAYTGAFSVYAADGGARTTTTVDWSTTYLKWAEDNMRLNGFTGSQHVFVRQSAVEFVNGLPNQNLFDLAVVDPPTFSNSKRTPDVWDVQQAYIDLLQATLRRMPNGGVIYFSNNLRTFKFDETAFGNLKIVEISRQTVPQDFRNRRVHRCWYLEKR